jgi:hypothetical protein
MKIFANLFKGFFPVLLVSKSPMFYVESLFHTLCGRSECVYVFICVCENISEKTDEFYGKHNFWETKVFANSN